LAEQKVEKVDRKKVLIPGAGYRVQQERPAEVNRLLVEFVTSMQQ
jgi:pimeloyl-ACP methyl ester carboxylesterase